MVKSLGFGVDQVWLWNSTPTVWGKSLSFSSACFIINKMGVIMSLMQGSLN